MKRVRVFGAVGRWCCDIAWLKVLAIALGLGVFVSPGALALSESEASRVVGLLEALQPELGDFAYDAGIAADWFEQDAENQGLIEAAGFTENSWKTAVDETFCGFLATVPEAEILQPFADARRRAQETKSLTPSQRQAALQMADEQQTRVLKWRAEGKAFAQAVRPVASRMRTISGVFPIRE